MVYNVTAMVTNMIVELSTVSFGAAQEEALERLGITLTNEQGVTSEEQQWIMRMFNATWSREAGHAWNWVARDASGAIVGFASYEQRHYRWWWLRNWRRRADVGIFGPMGVAPASRGQGLGCILTQRALASIKDLGFQWALIPRIGPAEFYKRCCGAVIADQVRLFGIF